MTSATSSGSPRQPSAVEAATRFAIAGSVEAGLMSVAVAPGSTAFTVIPLIVYSNGWLLIAWCPDRQDFRVFRLDRMERVALANTTFTVEPGRDLEAYLIQRVVN
jgi:hypothetical protein